MITRTSSIINMAKRTATTTPIIIPPIAPAFEPPPTIGFLFEGGASVGTTGLGEELPSGQS